MALGVTLGLLDSETLLVAGILVLSAALQTSTGFGFALLSAPVLAALVGPVEAVSTIVASGVVVDVLVLAADGRFPQPRTRDVLALGAWSVPGLLLGALLLRVLPDAVLQLVVAAAVLFAVGHRLATRRSPRSVPTLAPERWWAPALAGLTSGALSTATTLGGPPVVLYLTRRPRSPRQTRDTLVALSLLRLPLSVAALLVAGTLVVPPELPVLWLAVAGGYLIGRAVFARLDFDRYERAVLGALLAAAVVAVVAAPW